ncbi:MAG: recombinase family protein [Acidimicrobiales bacterium]
MGRAAIYARQSITREGSASLTAQVEACRDTAKRLRLNVVAELVEAPSTSGYRNRGRNRPKFLELLDLIRSGDVDCVIAYKTDRLSRGGGPGWAPLVDAFEAAGRDPDRVIATTDGWVSEFEIGIRSAMDREESKKTSERMLDVRRREAKSGVPRIAGRRAYGYTRDFSATVDNEVAMIHEAVDRVLAGESIWSICGDWNRREIPTVTGSAWTVQTLTSILRSGRIAGLREHRGAVVAKGQWPPIITSEVRDELLVLLAAKRPAGNRARRYPLVGLLVCGRCGAPLRSLGRQGGGRSYACRSGPGLGGCGGIRIQAPGVEDHVRDVVCGMLADPVTRAALGNLGGDADTEDDHDAPGEILRTLSAKRQRLIDLYTDGDIDRGEFRTRRDAIDDDIREVETQIGQRQGNRVLHGIPDTYDELADEWERRGVEFQRRLTALLLEPISVQPAGSKRRTFDPDRLDIVPRA